ncbi:MAG: alpha/beta hydrolase [Oscillochloridaceae bacterium umkhey_bin13]
MRRLILISVMALLLAGCAAPVAPASETLTPTLALSPCRLSAAGAPRTLAAECGTLFVPEDYANPTGTQLGLRIAVLPAVGRVAASDALVLLAGGPGQAATDAFIAVLPTLSQANQSRDIVMVDQRGTGGSNRLHCPIPNDDPALLNALPNDPVVQAWLEACLADLPGDPQYYTTVNAARDLEAVRLALGYEQFNLLGVSYGTRLAQTYLRLFPAQTRSLILDGVVPPDMAVGAAMDADSQRALDLTFAACAEDPACGAAFPDLAGTFAALLSQLEREPALVTLDDPFTGLPTEVQLTREAVASTIFTLSYTPETTALIPLLIARAYHDGDLRPLAAQSLILGRQNSEMIALGLRNAVLCTEDVPHYPVDPVSVGYLGSFISEVFAAACLVWPQGEVDPAARTPLRSEVPTLLLSGERDPVTPPAYADAVAGGLPNSLHLVARGQGHNVFFRGCIPGLLADFLNAGSVAGLEPACVERLDAPPLFTRLTGPTP